MKETGNRYRRWKFNFAYLKMNPQGQNGKVSRAQRLTEATGKRFKPPREIKVAGFKTIGRGGQLLYKINKVKENSHRLITERGNRYEEICERFSSSSCGCDGSCWSTVL